MFFGEARRFLENQHFEPQKVLLNDFYIMTENVYKSNNVDFLSTFRFEPQNDSQNILNILRI